MAPVADNATQGQVTVRLDGNMSIDDESAASEAVLKIVEDTDLNGWTPLVTGASFLLKDINDYLQKGMLTLGAIAVVVMILALSFAFRVRWRLVPFIVMIVGVIWTFGLLGYAGFRLSLVTIAGLPILIGLGVEFAIQVHNRIEEEVGANKDPAPFAKTLRNIGPALLVATVAAAIACIALQASKVPMIRDFGVLLALGIVIVFIAAIIVPVAVLSIREHRKPTTSYHHQPLVEGTITKMAHLPQWTVVPMVLVAVALFVGGLFAEERTPIQTDPEKWVDQESAVIKSLDQLRAQTASSSELGVFVQVDEGTVFTDETSAFVTEFTLEELASFPQTLQTASSLPMVVYYLTEVPGASRCPPPEPTWRPPTTVAPDDLQVSLVGGDASRAQHRLPHRPVVARGPQGGRRRHPGQRHAAARHHRDAVGPRRGRRGPARQPHGQPPHAHLPRDRWRRALAAHPVPEPRQGRRHPDPRAPRRRPRRPPWSRSPASP